MGIVAGLLLAPIMGPVWGCRVVLQRLHDEAAAELYDEGRVFAQMIQLSMSRSAGQIAEDEYAEQEAQLLERVARTRDPGDEPLDDDAFEAAEVVANAPEPAEEEW